MIARRMSPLEAILEEAGELVSRRLAEAGLPETEYVLLAVDDQTNGIMLGRCGRESLAALSLMLEDASKEAGSA